MEARAGKPVSVLPDINTAEVQLGARHASHQSAIIYVNLAATLFWEWDDLDPLERKRHDIPNWKSIFLGYELSTRLTDYQGGRKLPLPELASIFVNQTLRLEKERSDRGYIYGHPRLLGAIILNKDQVCDDGSASAMNA